MISPSANMNLSIWDLGSDPYSHNQLASNFSAIDQHDHSAGKGIKVGTGGIANQAITTPLIANQAVGNAQLADNSVTSPKIAPGEVKSSDIGNAEIHMFHFGPDVTFMPPGAVVPFAGSVLPSNFLFCDGSVVGQGAFANLFAAIGTAYNIGGEGGGNFRLPDLQTRVPVGKGLNDTTALGQTEGVAAASRTWGHSHVVNSHAHNAPHNHGIFADSPATNFQSDHQHVTRSPIGKDPFVSQQYYIAKPEDAFMDPVSGPENGSFVSQDSFNVATSQNTYSLAPGVWAATGSQIMTPSYQFTTAAGGHAHVVNPHSHSGGTTTNALVTDSQAPGTNNVRASYITLNYLIRT